MQKGEQMKPPLIGSKSSLQQIDWLEGFRQCVLGHPFLVAFILNIETFLGFGRSETFVTGLE